jgi:hypothetical protein
VGHKPARYVNIALGIWLVLSSYLWPHSSAQFANLWISGLIVARFAAVAITTPQLRFFNSALGIWLILSPFLLSRLSIATAWNNVLVGAVITLASLVGPGRTFSSRARTQPPL